MAIEIPGDVAFFLNCCGIAYPDINEDEVRAFAGHVRAFASNLQHTHRSATSAIKDMNSVYSAYSYEQLVASWATVSTTHMAALDGACKVLATALDVAASVIAAVKVATLTELAALAASFVVVLATPGLGLTSPVIVAAARKLCDNMAQSLIAYFAAEVIGKAIEPFEHIVSRMVDRAVYGAVSHALDVSPAAVPALLPLHIEPGAVLHYAEVLDHHADDLMRHVATFADNVAGLNFAMSGQFDGIDGSIRPAYPTAAIVPAGLPLLKPHPEVLRTAARPSDPLPANIGSRSRVASAVGPDIANPIAAQMPSGRWHIADPGIGDASPVNGPVRTEIGSVRIAQAEPALNPRAGVRGSGPAVGPGDLPGQSVGPGTPESRSSVASIGPDGYMLFSPSTTPWARLARVGEQLAAAQPGIGRPTTTHPASGPPRVKTPWSKIERPIAAAKVFAPVQRGPASRPRREQEAVETNRDLDSGHSLPTPDTVTLSTAQALEAPHRER